MPPTPNQSDPDIVIPVPVFPRQTDSGDACSVDLSRPIVNWSREVFNASGGAKNKSELLRKLGQVLNSTGCLALWIIKREADEEWSHPINLLGDDDTFGGTLLDVIQTVAQCVGSEGHIQSVEPQGLPGYVLIGAPIETNDSISDILVALYPSSQPRDMPFEWSFSKVVDTISKWQMQQFARLTQTQIANLSNFVNMSAAINRTDNHLDAAVTLVNELNVAIDTGLVALLLKSGSSERFKIAAMSGIEFFDRNATTTQTIESSILGLQDQPTFWSPLQTTHSQNSAESHINLLNFCQSMELPGCAALPLHDQNKNTFGWLLIGLKDEQCGEEKTEIQFVRISKLVAGHLETVLRAQRPITRTLLDNTFATLKKNPVRKFAMLLAIGIILLCIPTTYKIACDCQLELTRRRFVAAPYEGLLENTIVENGDIVTQGQVLARMDASQLRMEMSSLQADMERERKKRDSALARRNVAESQIASSEMKRLASEVAIISNRLSHTEIRSPIDGVIISGDLDKAEGAPMETGQNLFEVGPLEKILVEILIPENEIQHVAAGMPVRFEFNAFPFETFRGEIQRIHPRAEVLDQQCVFVAHVQLDNETKRLRPGLKGRAKILGETHTLGWNLFHGVWENARKVLIW